MFAEAVAVGISLRRPFLIIQSTPNPFLRMLLAVVTGEIVRPSENVPDVIIIYKLQRRHEHIRYYGW